MNLCSLLSHRQSTAWVGGWVGHTALMAWGALVVSGRWLLCCWHSPWQLSHAACHLSSPPQELTSAVSALKLGCLPFEHGERSASAALRHTVPCPSLLHLGFIRCVTFCLPGCTEHRWPSRSTCRVAVGLRGEGDGAGRRRRAGSV